jgi:flagellin
MAQTINTNIASLNAQRNLNSSQSSLSTSLQRLSSGLRINSAKDDAAGLAISERMNSQIKGLSQASRNANDGISLAQTAEGAMAEIGNNLQRIRELSVQSSNATNSQTDRDALQAEVTQLVAEIDRVANQTSFNGTKLLDGSFASQVFQIGADAGQTIGINSILDSNANALGAAKFTADVNSSAFTNAAADDTFTGLTINGITIADVEVKNGDTAGTQATAVANAINAKMDQTGVYAELDAAAGTFTLHSIKANEDLVIAGAGAADYELAAATTTAAASTAVQIEDIDISSFTGSQQAMEIIDKALTSVNSGRAELGAVQNRFSSTIANLAASSENLSASRSRILDADFASETANLSRTQILQQAGTAMLAQANSLPQNVLSLLQ